MIKVNEEIIDYKGDAYTLVTELVFAVDSILSEINKRAGTKTAQITKKIILEAISTMVKFDEEDEEA